MGSFGEKGFDFGGWGKFRGCFFMICVCVVIFLVVVVLEGGIILVIDIKGRLVWVVRREFFFKCEGEILFFIL